MQIVVLPIFVRDTVGADDTVAMHDESISGEVARLPAITRGVSVRGPEAADEHGPRTGRQDPSHPCRLAGGLRRAETHGGASICAQTHNQPSASHADGSRR